MPTANSTGAVCYGCGRSVRLPVYARYNDEVMDTVPWHRSCLEKAARKWDRAQRYNGTRARTDTSWEQHAATLERFLASPDFKRCLIDQCCHSRAWLYEHQTVCVELLPNGTWVAPAQHTRARRGTCIVPLKPLNYYARYMEQIGETRDFEDILRASAEEARTIAGRLADSQEEYVKSQTRGQFAWMRERGYLD